jgi:hypothetical protein
MKKISVSIILIVFSMLMMCACGKENKTPDEVQVKDICELATIECYYNNVAKGIKKAGKGWEHVLEKDRTFWIEYEGFVTIGIDMKQVSMTIDKEVVTICMPKAEVLGKGLDKTSLNEDSYKISNDAFWNKNKITAEDQQKAIAKAQKKMEKETMENELLFEKAEEEAKKLIENYINKLGEVTGKKYEIRWKIEKKK